MDRSRLVLDTNVFVAAGFNPGSASARILDAVDRERLRLVWDEATRGEIERILHRIPPLRSKDVAGIFRARDRFPGPTFPERFGHVPDPEDRKFAALAHAAAALLVSSDDHLLGVGHPPGLTVLTPGEFWRRMQLAEAGETGE